MSAPLHGPRTDRRVLSDLAALVGAELIAKLVGFAAFAYLARVLSPENYGGVELAVQIALALGMFVDFGLGPIGARAVAAAPQHVQRIASEIATLRIALAIAAFVCGLALASAIDVGADVRALVRVVALSLIAVPFVSSWLFQGLGRMGWVAGGQLLRMCVFAALVFLLVQGDDQLLLVGLAELTAMLAMAGWYLLAQAQSVGALKLGAPAARLRALASQALPVGLSRGFASLQQYGPTLVVAQLAGSSELAWFAAAHRLVTSLGAFVEIHLFNLYPQLVRAAVEGPGAVPSAATPSFRASAWAGCGVALATTLLATPLLRIAFGAHFEAGAEALRVAAWSLPLALLAGHVRFALIAVEAQRAELAATIAGAASTILVALLCVPTLGLAGAAIALPAGAAVVWGAAHWLARARGMRMPIAPALRAFAAAGGVALAAASLSSVNVLAAAVAVAAYVGLALLWERELSRDVARLLARPSR